MFSQNYIAGRQNGVGKKKKVGNCFLMPFPMIVEGPVGWMGLEHAYVKKLLGISTFGALWPST